MTPDPVTSAPDHPFNTGHRPTDDEKLWGLLAHVLALVSLFFGPILVLVVKGNESKWVKAHAIEALNFSITLFIAYLMCVPLVIVFIGFFLLCPLALAGVILHLIAGVKAFQGGSYRYPIAFRFLKD